MHKKLSFSVSMVVPVFNGEKKVIGEIKKAAKEIASTVSDYEILIADDKSTDNTSSLLEKHFKKTHKITLILNKQNKGIAKNIKYLYSKAKKEYVFFFVADGDWNTKSIKKLLHAVDKSKADIVIGKRNIKQGYTFYRKVISFFHNTLPILFFGVRTFDAGSLKIYNRKYLNTKHIKSNSVFLDAEIIIRASKKGARIESRDIPYKKPITTSGVAAKPKLVLYSIFDLIKLRLSLL